MIGHLQRLLRTAEKTGITLTEVKVSDREFKALAMQCRGMATYGLARLGDQPISMICCLGVRVIPTTPGLSIDDKGRYVKLPKVRYWGDDNPSEQLKRCFK